MYTPAEFNRLANPQKWAIIEDHGTYMELCRLQGELKICLFSLADYYVEVFYHPKQDRLLKAAAFVYSNRLDPYLKQIDILPIYAVL